MSSILDKIRAQKAAQAQATSAAAPAAAPIHHIEPVGESPLMAIAVAQAPAVVDAKPLTFAEKLALKRAQEAQQEAKPAVAPKPELFSPELAPPAAALAIVSTAVATIPNVDQIDQRAEYSEIASRIDELQTLGGDNLRSAMADLKKALMANPAACELMLDEDIGKMVASLRRMLGEEVVAAEEGKKNSGKKPKAVQMRDLTPQELLDALEEI
jgi:hypothetical protein